MIDVFGISSLGIGSTNLSISSSLVAVKYSGSSSKTEYRSGST